MRNQVITEHYNLNHTRLTKVVSGRLGGSIHLAEEAVQEAYSRALTFFDKCNFDTEHGFNGWFATILNNTVKDVSKTERNRGLNIDEVCESNFVDKINLHNSLSIAVISREIATLRNTLHSEVLRLALVHGMSHKDVAMVTDVSSHNTVRTILRRFKSQMISKYS